MNITTTMIKIITSSLAVFSSPIFSFTVSLNSSTAVLTVFMLLMILMMMVMMKMTQCKGGLEILRLGLWQYTHQKKS